MTCLPIAIQLTANLLLAIGSNGIKMLPFGHATARQPNAGFGIICLLGLHVKEVRRLHVTVALRYITEIVK